MKEQSPTIRVSIRLKKELDKRVVKKGDSYEDIIWRLLK
jgi:hypothetical protein